MPTIEQHIIDCEMKITRLKAIIRPFAEGLTGLEESLRRLKSKKWIKDNAVTSENVQNPPETPFHNTISDFRTWLVRTKNTKPFVSWNSVIIPRADLEEGRWMWDDLHGRIEDLNP